MNNRKYNLITRVGFSVVQPGAISKVIIALAVQTLNINIRIV